jgi:diphthamide synthase (EF-2-diphthine--ammonia ligase)
VLGIPLFEVVIPPTCVNEIYEARMAEAFATAPLSGVEAVAFGDLFLEDVRAYREGRLAAAGKRGLFPLWGHDTAALAHEFLDAGFEATLVCVDPRALDPAFCGRSSRRASTPAARTASSTPSSPGARSSPSRSPASAARSSSAMALSSAT